MQLSQIVPMDEEETGEEGPAIVNAKILDPYVILLRVDGSVLVYKLDKSMELAEEGREDIKVCPSRVSIKLWLIDPSECEIQVWVPIQGSTRRAAPSHRWGMCRLHPHPPDRRPDIAGDSSVWTVGIVVTD